MPCSIDFRLRVLISHYYTSISLEILIVYCSCYLIVRPIVSHSPLRAYNRIVRFQDLTTTILLRIFFDGIINYGVGYNFIHNYLLFNLSNVAFTATSFMSHPMNLLFSSLQTTAVVPLPK